MYTSEVKNILRQFLGHKYLTEKVLTFLSQKGILDLLSHKQSFAIEEVTQELEHTFGYTFHDRTRQRMVSTFIDLLKECGFLRYSNGQYSWNKGHEFQTGITGKDYEMIRVSLKGQIEFFEKCLAHVNDFLKGGSPLYDFNNHTISVWDNFLGNPEFTFARSALFQLLMCNEKKNYEVLDLCYGPGFNLIQIQQHCPEVNITALDFKDIFQDLACTKLDRGTPVQWIKSEQWQGFGTPLPFHDNTFDLIFFSCADPYIPSNMREYVYADIFRTLKPSGLLGILTHSYPDTESRYVKDPWIRRGVLCHDFSESVCQGWHGFTDPLESVKLFKKIGYNINAVVLNSSLWKLEKP